MNRDDAPSTFSQAWAQLTGYVTEARDDGDGLDPAQLLSYMTELRGEVLATALTEAFPPAPVGGQAESTQQEAAMDERELDWAITDVPLPSGGFGIKYPTRVFERTGSRGAHIANSLALPGLTELVDEANNLRRAYEAKVAELAAETARHPVGGQADEGSLTTCPSCGEDHTDDGVCRPEGPSISQRRDGAWRHDRCDGYVIFRAGGWECGECGAGQQAEPSDGEMLLAARSFDGMAEDCDNNAADLGELTRPRWAGKAEGLRWAAEELRHRVEKARHVRAAAVSGEHQDATGDAQ